MARGHTPGLGERGDEGTEGLNQQRGVKQEQRRRMDGERSQEDLKGARAIVNRAIDER